MYQSEFENETGFPVVTEASSVELSSIGIERELRSIVMDILSGRKSVKESIDTLKLHYGVDESMVTENDIALEAHSISCELAEGNMTDDDRDDKVRSMLRRAMSVSTQKVPEAIPGE